MRWIRRGGVAAVTVILMAVLAFTVFPTRTYLEQRASTDRAEETLAVLTERTEALEEQAARLDTDEEIERQAREEYGMVKPGEEAYVVLPPPLPEIDLPRFWLLGDPDEPTPLDAAELPVPEIAPTPGG